MHLIRLSKICMTPIEILRRRPDHRPRNFCNLRNRAIGRLQRGAAKTCKLFERTTGRPLTTSAGGPVGVCYHSVLVSLTTLLRIWPPFCNCVLRRIQKSNRHSQRLPNRTKSFKLSASARPAFQRFSSGDLFRITSASPSSKLFFRWSKFFIDHGSIQGFRPCAYN